MQTDSLLSRLKGLKERIDATEAHVTLDLDHRRNQIVSFNLVSSRAGFYPSLSQHGILYISGPNAYCHIPSAQSFCMRVRGSPRVNSGSGESTQQWTV